MGGIFLPQTVHMSLTSIFGLLVMTANVDANQGYRPLVSLVTYSEITTHQYILSCWTHRFTTLVKFYQKTIEVTNNVKQIIITFVNDFVITKLTISDTVSAFSSSLLR